jgi:hypothetical protein
MDEDRKIRFLVAPTLFAASLLLGAWFDPAARSFMERITSSDSSSKMIGVIAGGGVVVFAAGYVVGTWNYFILRVCWPWLLRLYGPKSLRECQFHEVALSEAAFAKIWETFGLDEKDRKRGHELVAAVAYGHGILSKQYEGIHRWMFRRWNAFVIATTSFWSLIFSFPFGLWVVGIRWTYAWAVPVALFVGVLVPVMVGRGETQ